MADIKKAHLIGLGAVGATYASLLHKAEGSPIEIIVDEERAARYKEGILINGETIHFNLALQTEAREKAELILIAVKAHHLEATIEAIRPFVGSETLILPLLNGITSEEILAKAFGREKILHGFCVALDSTKVNNEIRFTQTGKIVFGTAFGLEKEADSVKAFFIKTKVPHTKADDILREKWWKFMMNVGINQISSILGANYGVFQKQAKARELMKDACLEVLKIAEAKQIQLSEADIDGFFPIIDGLSPEGKTSMLQDIEAGRKTEVELFSLAVIELGKKLEIATPVNTLLYKMIRVLEEKNS